MFENDKPIFNPIHELIIIFGDCGVGKSSLIAHFIDVYLKKQGAKRWELSEQIIRELNVKRKTPLSFPTAPPIYSNIKGFKLKTRNGADFKPIYLEGKDVGITKGKEKYKPIFPASLLVFDEAHSEFCSKGERLPKGQQDFFNKRRHNRIIMILAAPRAVLIHKDIRNTGARFIEVLRQENERDLFGKIHKTTWHCRECRDKSAIEEYIATDGKNDNFTEITFTHNGNVYDLYDSFAFVQDFAPANGEDYET